MNRILCALLLLFLASSSSGQVLETRLLKLEKDRFKAMIKKDSNFLAVILSEDLVYIHSNGAQDTKESFIKSITSGNLEYFSIDVQNADIKTNNSTVWIHGAAKMKVRNGKDAQPVELMLRYLD